MFWFVFIGLLGYSAYQLFGVLAAFLTTLPLILALPFMAAEDTYKWWKFRGKRARDATRQQEWYADTQRRLARFEEEFPENGNVDDQGIPY